MKVTKQSRQAIGVDFGWDHPFAAAGLAWDRDADVIYVMKTIRGAQSCAADTGRELRPLTWETLLTGMEREWFTRRVTCPKCKKSGFVDLSEEVGRWAGAHHPTLKRGLPRF